MTENQDKLIAQLEAYLQNARTQLGVDHAQDSYWRGVLFGLDLALLEARKRPAPPEVPPVQANVALTAEFYTSVNKLVFEHLENLIALCEARIKRDLLAYNARVARYELLKAIRRMAQLGSPSDYEVQANPDLKN